MTAIENSTIAPAKEQITLRAVYHNSKLSKRPIQTWFSDLIALIGSFYWFLIIYLPHNWYLFADLIMLFAWILYYVTNRWRRRKLTPVENDDDDDDDEYEPVRLRASGRPEEIDPISQLQDVPFEPVIILKAYSTVIQVVLVVLLFPLLIFFPVYYDSWEPYHLIVVILIIWLLPKTIQWLYPVYYRVVPGRFDVLRSTPLSDRVQIREQWDLRASTIVASFKEQTLVITEPDGDELHLNLSVIYEPYRLVNAVFHAAICTHPAPPLPEDQLLG